MLRYAVSEQELPRNVLDREIALIEKIGVKFKPKTRIGEDLSLQKLSKDYRAVFLAVGRIEPEDVKSLGLEPAANGIAIDKNTYQTSLPGVFAGGDAVHKRKLTVRAVADGKQAAVSIDQYLSGSTVTGPTKEFNTHIGKLVDGEIDNFLNFSDKSQRVNPSAPDGGFTEEQARKEAARCLHCDCRKVDECKLKQYAQLYDAKPTRFKGPRRTFIQHAQHPEIIYEPGKCIDCGLCIQIAAEESEELGLTFIGRGFDVKVAVPFDRSMAQALKKSAHQCVNACPTGALAFAK